MAGPAVPNLGVRANDITLLLPIMLLHLQHLHAPRGRPVQALAAQASVQLGLIGRRYQQALRRLCRLKVPGGAAGVRGATAGSSLHGPGWRFRPSMGPLPGPLGTVRLRGGRVQITVTEPVATERLGSQIVPGLRLGVLKARRWSLVHTGVPVQSVRAQASCAGGDAVSGGGDVAAGDGMETVPGGARAIMRTMLLLRLLRLFPLHVVMLHLLHLLLLLLLLLLLILLVPRPPLLFPAPATGHAIGVAARASQVVGVQASAVRLLPASIRAGYAGDAEAILRRGVKGRWIRCGGGLLLLLLARFVRLGFRWGARHAVRLVVAVPRRGGHPGVAGHLREEVVVVTSGPWRAHRY